MLKQKRFLFFFKEAPTFKHFFFASYLCNKKEIKPFGCSGLILNYKSRQNYIPIIRVSTVCPALGWSYW